MTIDWATSLGVTQHTSVVDEWCRSLVRLSMELDEHPLNIEEVAIQGIQESSGLQMFRGSASERGHRQRGGMEGQSLLTSKHHLP
jgi:hypothetical protein